MSFKVSFLLSDRYLRNLYSGNRLKFLLSALFAYLRRFVVIIYSRKFDIIWLEKELFPWLPAFIESHLLSHGPPYVVDYDDAIFHNYDQHPSFFVRKLFGNKIKNVMKGAATVVAGNRYIADYAQEVGQKHVEIIPTVLDPRKYEQEFEKHNGRFNIGWIGSPSTSRHLRVAEPALKEICRNNSVQLITIGAQPGIMTELPASVIPWSEGTEVEDLRSFDVGIMPLPDTKWERGKCGFKLIQYMACGLPVIASPVWVNKEIVDHGVNGFLAGNTDEWIEYLQELRKNPDLCDRMGTAGQKKVKEEYSLQVAMPKLVKILKEAAEA